MAREYFCCYHSYLEVMEQLNDTERGRLFTACLTYSKTGEVPELRGNERFVFPSFRSQIDRDNANYKEDAIIVLGAAVQGDTPSLALADRLDSAVEYYNKNIVEVE